MRSVRSFRFAIVAAIVVMLLAAVRHSASVSVTLVVTVAGLLGTIAWLVGRNIRRQADGIEALRAVKEGLEREAEARAADLRDANARLRSIIDSAVDGIIVIDVQGRIEAFNRGAERLFGYPESEVLGRNVSVLMPSPDQGPGIPAGVAEKVFMPFFTTKARGSGLGLVTHLLRRPMLRRDPLAYRRSTHEP